jgi:iron complex outermembrane receptor protein
MAEYKAVAGFVLAALAGGASALPGLSHAADSQDAAAGGGALEEIVVTAQRRSESLSKVPVSISALSADTLQKQAVITESDLQVNVPGLVVRATTNSNQLNYSIRGQTVDAFTGSQPAVLPYFDEIQVTSNSSSAFYDLESIQVLKGPQGTLFGRNATGGAVLLTSAKPTNDLGGFINLSAGNYDFKWAQGAVNFPLITDKLLLRVAGDMQSRDGFVTNLYNNTRLGAVDKDSFRVSLLAKPTDQLTNTTVADYGYSGGSDVPAAIYSAYAPGSKNNGYPLFTTASVLYSPFLDTAVGFPGAWNAYLAAHPGVPAGGLVAYAATQAARGPYVVDINDRDAHRSRSFILSNITAFDIAGGAQIKNIAGYTRSSTFDSTDLDGTPYTIEGMNPAGFNKESHQFSDELQGSGKTLADQLQYIGGVYYANARNGDITDVYFFDVSPIIPATEARFDSAILDKTVAGYGQGSFDLSKATGVAGLSVSAGARYTSDKLTQEILPTSRFYDLPGLPNEREIEFNKVSWQFGVQEQLDPKLLLYVATRRSFRSGGFNPFAPQVQGTAAVGGNQFDAEVATDVELGLKFQGLLASTPIRFDFAVYDGTIDNVQRSIYIPTPQGIASLTVNVPQAKVKGVEFDTDITPVPWLDLGVNLAYTDAKFTENSATVFGQTQVYGPFADTPKFAGSLYAQTSTRLPQGFAKLTIRGEVYDQSLSYFGSQDASTVPGVQLPGYALTNFRVGLEDILGSKATVAAYVKNAFNKVYYVGGVPNGADLSLTDAVPGDRRVYFIQLGYKF